MMHARHHAISGLVFLLITSLGLGLGLVLAGCQPASAPPKPAKQVEETLTPEAQEHLKQAQKFLATGKMDEALKEFQEAARVMPNSPLIHYWLGKAYFYRKEKDQSLKAFQKVLELDPKNYHAQAMLGKLYSFDREKLDLAQKYLQEALEQSPDNLDIHFDLGRVYAMKGERNKTLSEFHAIFSTEADFFLYHFEMGRIFESWGEKEKALQEYKRALMFNPNLEPATAAIKRLEGQKEEPAAAPAPAPKSPAPPKR